MPQTGDLEVDLEAWLAARGKILVSAIVQDVASGNAQALVNDDFSVKLILAETVRQIAGMIETLPEDP